MVKKMYISAVVLFLLAAAFVKDKPDFPQSTEVKIISETIEAEYLADYPLGKEDREYYSVSKTVNLNVDRIYTTVVLEAVCRIQKDESGKESVTSIEYANITDGANDYKLEEIIFSKGINPQFAYVHYIGALTKEETVSRLPLLKALPGIFLSNTDITVNRRYYSDSVNIALRIYPEEIAEMSQPV